MKTKAYPNYKTSGVEWLGDVPEHWEVKKVGFLFSVQLGKMLQPDSASGNDELVPYLKALHVQWEKINFDDLPEMWASPNDVTKFSVKNGDLLVCEGGEVGRAAILNGFDKTAIIQNALHRVRSNTSSVLFLMYVLESASNQKWFEILCNKATIAHLTGEKFSALRIPSPTLPEQQAIATFLDRETGHIDALIAKKKRLLSLLAEQRTALISRAVTKGLTPFKLKPSGVEWLGDVPEHWEVKRVKHIVFLRSGEGITTDDIDDTGDYPVYGGNGFRGYTSNFTHEGHYALIGRQGALCGNINYAIGKFWASEHAVVASPSKPHATIWLGELLRLMNLNQYSISAAQPGLAIDRIKELQIPVPPLPDQQAIAAFLDCETAKIDTLSAKVQKAIERLREYRTALISAAVTGKIDVREAV